MIDSVAIRRIATSFFVLPNEAPPALQFIQKDCHMLILSHRGYQASSHENTLAAFEAAISLGVDGVETDIRVTVDGLPILFHDRLIDGTIPVESLTLDELIHRTQKPVPLLEEALHAFPNILWDLEIKTETALEPTINVLTRFADTSTFLITSFWHNIVKEACRRLNVRGGLLVAHSPLNITDLADSLLGDTRCNTIVWDWETCTRAHVAHTIARGIDSYVYGLETQEEFDQFKSWGGIGIITDHPQLFTRGR